MPQQLKVQPTRFINAEPGVCSSQGKVILPVPVVILSFGAEDGLIEDRAVGIVESRQMVMDILSSLAKMGDSLAQAITNQYFGPQQGSAPEFKSDFDDSDGFTDHD